MTEVAVSKSIQVPAKRAWEMLSSFRGIENYSPIEKSVTTGVGAGATRVCYLPDGAAIHEVLDSVENESMEFQYKITEGPFPIVDYVSNVKVSSKGEDLTTITWGCTFECSEEVKEEMVKLFKGFYNVIIDSLEGVIQSKN